MGSNVYGKMYYSTDVGDVKEFINYESKEDFIVVITKLQNLQISYIIYTIIQISVEIGCKNRKICLNNFSLERVELMEDLS